MDVGRQSIFRREAVETAAGTQIGTALTTHWRTLRVFTTLCFVLVAGILAFVATVRYSPIQRVPAYTDARSGLARLSAPAAGQVIQIPVAEGRRVRKGELLALVSSDVLRADGGTEQLQLQRKLAAERETIDRELAAADEEAAANHAIIARRLAGLRLELGQLRLDLKSSEQLLASLLAQAGKLGALAGRGYVTEQALAEKRDEVAAQESRVASVRASLARIEREIATSEAERKLVDARLAGLIESRRREAGELERLMVQSESQAQQVIRAPVDGILSRALIAPGQSVFAGQILFTIAPAGEPLVARLLVPARAAALVAPEMQIKLVFRAYPQEKFGEFAARIDSVSESPALPADIERVMNVSEPAFIAVASLPEYLRAPDGRTLSMKPGMLAEALVPLEQRTVLEWMLEPLLRGFNQSAGQVPAAISERAQ